MSPCRTVGELDIPCCYMQREDRGGGGRGLTIVGVQQGQGALPAPVHPSLRDNQRKRERGGECEKRKNKIRSCEAFKSCQRQLIQVRK